LPHHVTARPFLKWAGGKGQLLGAYRPYFPAPRRFKRYFEPFLGGGAVFFYLFSEGWLVGKVCCLNDYNQELITTYRVLQGRLPELLARMVVREVLDRRSQRVLSEGNLLAPQREIFAQGVALQVLRGQNLAQIGVALEA
ncbi:MAG: hypothetical protein C4336_04315, partial [Armatimonadota bacterium]